MNMLSRKNEFTNRKPGEANAPRVSIVIPSLNQGLFLKEAIESILKQEFKAVELIVMDGGSADDTLDIIRRYEDSIAYWRSASDNGQSNAINEGWKIAKGDIVSYLNSDDVYLPGAICRAVEALDAHPEWGMVYGDGLWIDEQGKSLNLLRAEKYGVDQMLRDGASGAIPQPTVFIRRTLVEKVNGLDEALHMAMDFDLWLKIFLRADVGYIHGEPMAALRLHPAQKTQLCRHENSMCDIAILERALDDPLCPENITRNNNRVYTRMHVNAAVSCLWDKHQCGEACKYLFRAVKYSPSKKYVVTCFFREMAWRIYYLFVPVVVRHSIKRLRNKCHNARETRAGRLECM